LTGGIIKFAGSGDVWRIEYDDDCNIKTVLYDINIAPEFMNHFLWPFVSWDYSTTNIAMSRYDSIHKVGCYGFDNYRYINLNIEHNNLQGDYYSTGEINVNNSNVNPGNKLHLESNSNIIIKETTIEKGSEATFKIK